MAYAGQIQQNSGKRKRNDGFDDEDQNDDKTPVRLGSHDSESDHEDFEDSEGSEGNDDGEESDNEAITGDCEHNENDEALPNCTAYDKDFAQIGADLTRIPKAVLALLDGSKCNSTRVKGCRANAEDLFQLPVAKKEKVALLGNTGAGKSSLLNSLIGLPGMARAMSGGQACTCVGTAYESPFPGQTRPLASKVEYFDIGIIKELLSRLLTDYVTWTFNEQPDWDPDERQELQRLSMSAFTIFRSLFCDKKQFESPQAAQEWLRDHHEDNKKDALRILVGWCKELLAEKEADEGDHTEYLYADTQTELLEQLNPLICSSLRFQKPALWPLVHRIRIGIEGPRILNYITLVDLPGLDDTNQVRVNTTFDTMRGCDSLWIVSRIGRVLTDTSVDALLMRYGRSFKMIVVCTGIDDNIDISLANHLEAEGQSIGDYRELLQRERQLRKLIKQLSKKIGARYAKLNGRTKKRAKQMTDATQEKLQADIQSLKQQLSEAEMELPRVATKSFEILVDARNSNTIRRLKEEKASHITPEKPLPVFCVSNVQYEALKGAKVIHGPRLNVNSTGIPALRHFILKSAAPYQVQTLENHIKHQYTVFMKGLEMWAKSYSVEDSDELLEEIMSSRAKVNSILESYLNRLQDANKRTNVKALEDAQPYLVNAALLEFQKKKQWAWPTMRAFIRRDGNFKTAVAPKQSWNEEFLAEANVILKQQWKTFLDDQKDLSDKLRDDLLGLINSTSDTIHGHPASMVLPMDKIKDHFAAQLEGIDQACRDYQKDQEMELRNIQLDLTQDRHSSYFTQAMSEAYTRCKDDTGKGVQSRCLTAFEIHLTLSGDRSPFAITTKKLSAAIAKDSKFQTKSLCRKMDNIFESIHQHLRDIVDEEIDDHDEEQLRKQFETFLQRALPKFEEVKADLARIKRRYE